MIKKIFFICLALGCCLNSAFGQRDGRTMTTKIADLLAELPADNAARLESAMKQVADLGEDGYITLIGGLAGPGKGDNSAREYAIAGFTELASKPGRETWKHMAINAYCRALNKLADPQNKAFIISQFNLIGTDQVVTALEPLLSDDALADAACRALAKIHSAAAVTAMLKAFPGSNGKAGLSLIQALAESGSGEAAQLIASRIQSGGDQETMKAGLYALAQIADPASMPVMLKAAEASNYQYDPTNAVAALLRYAQHAGAEEQEKIGGLLLTKVKDPKLVDLRISALELMNAAGHRELLLQALDDPQFEYRAAAIRLAQQGIGNTEVKPWLKKMSKLDGPTQSLLAGMFGRDTLQQALPAILKLFNSKDQQARTAAFAASVNYGADKVLAPLIKASDRDTADAAVITQTMLRLKDKMLAEKISPYIPAAKPHTQVVLLNVLANRAASGQMGVVYASLSSKNPEVKKAAFSALKHIATPDSKAYLFDLLDRVNDPYELGQVQEAIIAALDHGTEKDDQTELIVNQITKAPADKKLWYYKVLGSIGGPKALAAIKERFETGNAAEKNAALEALASWSDAGSAETLMQIARHTDDQTYLRKSLDGYLELIRKSSYLPEQRLLLLRNVMAVAKDPGQKQTVIKDMEQAKCLNTLLYVGRYLDDPNLQQAAAHTLMNVAMAGTYHGELVRNLLDKTIAVIQGPDAGYQKEGMRKYIAGMDQGKGFVSMFNGKDLTGWKGLVGDPIKRSKMEPAALAKAQEAADQKAGESWKAVDGELVFQSHGDNLATVKKYGDFEMLVDWKIIDDKKGEGDAGIYLRGTPQVQIWDNARTNVGAEVGSGGLYNNQVNESKPLKVADNKIDEWNTFRILMKGDRVSVWLNGELVTDNVILENYWDRNLPIFAEEQIELQAHGSPVAYRDLYIREIPRPRPFELTAQEKKDGYKVLFDGTNMHHWTGNLTDYIIKDGNIAIEPVPGKGSGGNLYTKDEYGDFIFRFEFQLTPGANNGLGIRAPLEGDAAYVGMELQILDNDAPIYKDLHEYQYHGSVYGTIPAKRGFLKPVGEWNYEEVIAKGTKIKVILNGTVILDGDIAPFIKNGTPDGQDHPGLKRKSGHIGFLGHGSPLQFRNIRIKDLDQK